MGSIFAPLGQQPISVVALSLVVAYFATVWITRKFLRPAITSNLDPINIRLVFFTSPALIGIVLTPYFTNNYSNSYFIILLFLAIWLLIIRLAGKPKKIDLRDRMGGDFQTALLWLSLLIIILNVIVNMIIPGKIPLLTEGGVFTRFEATQNSRLLAWLSTGTLPMPGLIFALTQNARVRKFAAIAIVFQTAANLLFASKGAILTVVFILLNAMFVAQLRNETVRYKKLRKLLLYASVSVVCLAPFYLAVIGFGADGTALMALGVRFLGGFDQLIYVSQLDLLRGADFGSVIHSNLVEYQLMPFFKAVLSMKFDYSSVGQYVIAIVTGISIDGPNTYPNSNLILETVFTSGKYPGMVAFAFELACFYRFRVIALKRPITPFSLVFLYGMAFDPFGLLYSGQEWITGMIVVSLTVVLAVVLAALWNATRDILRLPSVAQLV